MMKVTGKIIAKQKTFKSKADKSDELDKEINKFMETVGVQEAHLQDDKIDKLLRGKSIVTIGDELVVIVDYLHFLEKSVQIFGDE